MNLDPKQIIPLALERLRRRKKRLPKRMPRMLYAVKAERYYKQNLLAMVETLRDMAQDHLLPHLERVFNKHHATLPSKQDSASDDFDEILGSFRVQFGRQYTDSELEALAEKTGKDVDYWHQKQIEGTLGRVLDIDVLTAEPWLEGVIDNFVADNVRLIKSIPDRYFNEVEGIVRQGFRDGSRWEDIADDLMDRTDVSESRAELIARDQVGKLQGQLNMERQGDLGIKSYIWRTALDERVRPEHEDREGEQFDWSDPPSDGHPGEPIQCRCYAEPVLDDSE